MAAASQPTGCGVRGGGRALSAPREGRLAALRSPPTWTGPSPLSCFPSVKSVGLHWVKWGAPLRRASLHRTHGHPKAGLACESGFQAGRMDGSSPNTLEGRRCWS